MKQNWPLDVHNDDKMILSVILQFLKQLDPWDQCWHNPSLCISLCHHPEEQIQTRWLTVSLFTRRDELVSAFVDMTWAHGNASSWEGADELRTSTSQTITDGEKIKRKSASLVKWEARSRGCTMFIVFVCQFWSAVKKMLPGEPEKMLTAKDGCSSSSIWLTDGATGLMWHRCYLAHLLGHVKASSIVITQWISTFFPPPCANSDQAKVNLLCKRITRNNTKQTVWNSADGVSYLERRLLPFTLPLTDMPQHDPFCTLILNVEANKIQSTGARGRGSQHSQKLNCKFTKKYTRNMSKHQKGPRWPAFWGKLQSSLLMAQQRSPAGSGNIQRTSDNKNRWMFLLDQVY